MDVLTESKYIELVWNILGHFMDGWFVYFLRGENLTIGYDRTV